MKKIALMGLVAAALSLPMPGNPQYFSSRPIYGRTDWNMTSDHCSLALAILRQVPDDTLKSPPRIPFQVQIRKRNPPKMIDAPDDGELQAKNDLCFDHCADDKYEFVSELSASPTDYGRFVDVLYSKDGVSADFQILPSYTAVPTFSHDLTVTADRQRIFEAS